MPRSNVVGLLLLCLGLSGLFPLSEAGVVYVSSGGNDSNNGGVADPVFSISRAFILAGAFDTIQVASGSYLLPQQDFGPLLKTVTIIGGGDSSSTTLVADEATVNSPTVPFLKFGVATGNNVTFQNLTLSSGLAPVLFMTTGAEVILRNCVLTSRTSLAMSVSGGRIAAIGSTFHAPSVLSDLGGSTQSTFSDCIFDSSVSPSDGGALLISSSSGVTFSGCVFRNNTATFTGGAVAVIASNVSFDGCTFEDNQASPNINFRGGGALLLEDSVAAKSFVNCTNCRFLRNQASSGGGVSVWASSFHCVDCLFTDSVGFRGGAVYGVGVESVILERSSFVNNSVLASAIPSYGGAVCVGWSPDGSFQASYCSFDANFIGASAGDGSYGGALALINMKTIMVEHSTFTNHAVSAFGAAVAVESTSNPSNARFYKFSNCSFENNTGTSGAALLLNGPISDAIVGTALVQDCLFANNTAYTATGTSYGGAVMFMSHYITDFKNCLFRSNFVSSKDSNVYAGALFLAPYAPGLANPPVRVINCTFDSNSIVSLGSSKLACGGAIHQEGVKLVITNSSFIGNNAGTTGGAVCNLDASTTDSLLMSSSLFDSNTAVIGGAVFLQPQGVVPATISVDWSDFRGNVASQGGAMYISGSGPSSISLAGCNFARNRAIIEGGAVSIDATVWGNLAISDSFFDTNRAVNHGGAVVSRGSFNITVSNSSFVNNLLNGSVSPKIPQGGAISIPTSGSLRRSLVIGNSTFSNNAIVAPGGRGGAVSAEMADVKIYRTSFFNCSSTSIGGAAYLRAVELLIEDSLHQGNQAVCQGGAVFLGNLDLYNVLIRRSSFHANSIYYNSSEALNGGPCASTQGGALLVYGPSKTTLEACNFTSNSVFRQGQSPLGTGSALALGGAVSHFRGPAYDSQLIIDSCVMKSNTAIAPYSSGGGLSVYGASGSITNSQFTNNQAYVNGGGVYWESSAEVSDLRFTNNVVDYNSGCVGGGIQVFAAQFIRISIADTLFTFNTATISQETVYCSFANGAGAAILGTSGDVRIVRSTFARNTVHDLILDRPAGSLIAASTAAVRIFIEPAISPPTTILLEDVVFSHNLVLTDYIGWGAAAINVPNAQANVTRCTFQHNGVFSWSGQPVGTGGGIFVGSSLPQGDGLALVKFESCIFENNTADNAGGATIRNSNALLLNNTWIANSAKVAGAVVLITSKENSKIWKSTIRNNNKFTLNRAGFGTQTDCCYSSLLAQGPGHQLYYDASTQFERNRFNPLSGFSSDVGCIVGAICTPLPTVSQGQAMDLSGQLVADGGTLNLTQVTAKMSSLKVWDSVFASNPSYVLLGDYNVTTVNSSLLNSAVVQTQGVGSLNLHGVTEVLGTAHPTIFSNSKVHNFGTFYNYESNVAFDSSILRNMPSGRLSFENFIPEVNWTGAPGALTKSQFVNEGEFSLSTGKFGNMTLDFSPSTSRLRFMVTNYWKPSTLKLDAQINILRGGALVMDGTPLRLYSEPKPFQEFLVVSAASASSLNSQFSERLTEGGYYYRLHETAASMNGPANITLVVDGFYPIAVQVSEEATFIRVRFPRPTNTPSGSNGYDCASILHPSFLNSLTSAKCLWAAATELNIRADTLSLGQPLQFIDAAITDASAPHFYVWGNYTHRIAPPMTTPSPRAVLVTAPTVRSCSDIVADASASIRTGAFAIVYSWELVSINDAAATGTAALDVSTFMSSKTSAVLTVPASMLDNSWAGLKIRLTVTSPTFGTSDQQEATIHRSLSPLIQLSVEGPADRVAPTAVDNQIKIRVSVPACSPLTDASRVVSSWTVVSAPQISSFEQRLYGKNTTTLYIPARTMAPDSTYTFKYTATVYSDSSLNTVLGSQSIFTNVTSVGSPMALVSSGDSGFISTAQSVHLRVRLDDPDDASLVANEPIFSWAVLECPNRGQLNTKSSSDAEIAYFLRMSAVGGINKEGASVTTLSNILARAEGAVCSYPNSTLLQLPLPVVSSGSAATQMTIPSGMLAPGEYTILVAAARGSRGAITLIKLNAFDNADGSYFYQVRIDADLRGADKHLPQNRLLLRGFINGKNSVPSGKSVRWSLVGESLASANILTSLDNINLVLAPASLLPGRAYTFQLDLYDAPSGALRGSNTLIVVVNSSPQGGSLVVNPMSATQGSVFTIALPGWIDDDPPVRYIASAFSASQGSLLLSDVMELESVFVVLPIAGDAQLNHTIEVRAYISDIFDSSTFVSTTIQVLPDPGYTPDDSATVATFDSLIHDLRFQTVLGAMQPTLSDVGALIPLTPASNVALLCEMVDSLDVFAHSVLPTPANMHMILSSLKLITTTSALPNCIVLGALQIMEATVRGTTSSAPTLVASYNSVARGTAVEVLKTVSNIINSISKSSSSLEDTSRLRLLQLLIDLARLQGLFSVVDESPTLVDGRDIFLLTANLSASSLRQANISLGNLTVLLDAVDSSTIDINLIRWINATFPLATNTTSTATTRVGKTIITILSSSNGAVTVIFEGEDTEGPSESYGSDPVGCGVFDSTQGVFDPAGCTLTSPSPGSYSCTCSRIGSLGLLFDARTSPQSVASVNVAAAVLVTLVVVIVVAVITTVLVVPSLRNRVFPFLAARSTNEMNVPLENVEPEPDSPKKPQNTWERGTIQVDNSRVPE